jgi:hypothetical protein
VSVLMKCEAIALQHLKRMASRYRADRYAGLRE